MISKILHSSSFNKAARNVLTLVLTVAMLFALVPVFSFDALAVYETKYGIISVSNGYLNIRASASVNSDSVGRLNSGDHIVIVGEETDTEGTVWYKIEYINSTGYHGYVSSKYVTLYELEIPEVDPDEGDPEENIPDDGTGGAITVITDIEEWMDDQGFPESYKSGIRTLHEKYPNWVFYADHIDYDWETVIAAQSVLGVSLVENSFPSSWKSTQPGAYDWEKSKWIALDGTRWVQASREIIEYYLDPRNFLDSTTVFQFMEQSFDGNVQTVAGVQSMLKGTFMEGNLPDEPSVTYAQLIFDVSKANNVNPYVIASMIITEQGTTGSALCNGKPYGSYNADGSTKYYNFFNFGAYGSDPVAAGLKYAQNAGWDTVRKSIEHGTASYANGYINIGQSTLYYKRFDFVGTPFGHQYSQSIYSPKVEGERAAKGYTEEMRQSALTFTIPVYDGMPETACVKPTGDGSPNIKLSSLKVEGFGLTPSFQPDTLEYTLVVPAETTSVNITAVTMDSTAKVKGTGTVNLPNIENTIIVTVTSGNGSTRDYKLTIAKEAPEVGGIDFSTTYKRSGTYIITGPGVTAETMTGNLLNSGSCEITHSDGSEKDVSEILKTGDKVAIYDENGESLGVYSVCVRGDVDGNGEVAINDFAGVRNHLLGAKTYTGISAAAADIDLNGTIDILDFTIIRNYLLGATTIG